MMQITTEKLSFHIVWIFGLLEMITVPLVAWLPGATFLGVKSPMEGAIVGFIGILLLFFILNLILPFLHWKIDGQSVTGLSVFSSAIWNAFLLAMLFAIQQGMGLIPWGPVVIHQMVSGFVSTFGAVFITILLYQFTNSRATLAGITIKTGMYKYTVKKFSIMTLSILAGIYEAIALPIILIWQNMVLHPVLVSLLTGLAGGILGSLFVVFLYNTFITSRILIVTEKTS